MMQLQVHQRQRLLHVLHVSRRVFQMSISDPHVGAQRSDFACRLKAGPKEATGVKSLEPLGVIDVALATRNGLAISRVGEHNGQSVCLQNLVDRYPIHPRGLHCYSCDTDGDQPIGHLLDIGSEALESSNWVVAQLRRYRRDLNA